MITSAHAQDMMPRAQISSKPHSERCNQSFFSAKAFGCQYDANSDGHISPHKLEIIRPVWPGGHCAQSSLTSFYPFFRIKKMKNPAVWAPLLMRRIWCHGLKSPPKHSQSAVISRFLVQKNLVANMMQIPTGTSPHKNWKLYDRFGLVDNTHRGLWQSYIRSSESKK